MCLHWQITNRETANKINFTTDEHINITKCICVSIFYAVYSLSGFACLKFISVTKNTILPFTFFKLNVTHSTGSSLGVMAKGQYASSCGEIGVVCSLVCNFYSEEVTVCFFLFSPQEDWPALQPCILTVSVSVCLSDCPRWLGEGLTGGSPTDNSDPQISACFGSFPFLVALLYPRSVELSSPSKHSPWLVWCSTRLEWRIVALTTPSSTTCILWSTVWCLS